MTINGWLQIAIYCVLIFLFVKPFGAYMANVFDGQRTLFRWCCVRSSVASTPCAA